MARAHPKATWAKLKSAYRRGEGSIAELAPKFGIPAATATTICARDKWVVERKEAASKAQARAVERDVESIAAMLGKHREISNRIRSLVEQRLATEKKLSVNMLDQLSQVMARMAPVERLAAGIEPSKPVMAFEAAGDRAVLRVKRKRNPDVPAPEGA